MDLERFITDEMAGLARFAGALTGDRTRAEDILSDALLKVVVRWRRISRMNNPAAYVRRIVVTTYLSDGRRARRAHATATGDLSAVGPAQPDPSARVADRDEVERLLMTLPRQQRAAVVLRYLVDATDEEIADALGCTTGTVRSHLSLARATLRLKATPPTRSDCDARR